MLDDIPRSVDDVCVTEKAATQIFISGELGRPLKKVEQNLSQDGIPTLSTALS